MFINNMFKRIRKAGPKQLVIAGAFVVALAGAVSLGHMTKQEAHAADCTPNSIINCGFATNNANDFAAKYKANATGDLTAIYSKYGMQPSELNKFVSSAKPGVAMKNGDIVVDGRVVATGGVSLGRNANSHYHQDTVNINGKTYYASRAQDVFLNDSIPVLVMFNDKGVMQFAVMSVCGNPTWGNPVVPNYACNDLQKTAVSGKDNTYDFSTSASAGNGAAIDHVVYDFGDGSAQVTKTNPTDKVQHTYTKEGNFTAKVTVYVKLPGGNSQIIAPAGNCTKPVTVKLPFYACVQLAAVALNDQKTKFRFTTKLNYGNGATPKSVDFTVDDKTTAGVVAKDDQGNYYQEYTFEADAKSHTVVAKVNFNVANGVQSSTCKATVTSTKAPMCTVPGKENFPPNAPECQPECKPGVPVGSPKCEDTPPQVLGKGPELPSTGMGNVFGLFAGTSAAGAAVHRVIVSRRRRS